MDIKSIINGILESEGPGKPPTYLAPGDSGGRTSWGISERSHPEMWRPGPPSREQAYAIILAKYVTPLDRLIEFLPEPFIAALADDAVLSGGGYITAVKRLQAVLGVDIDGVLGHDTLYAIHSYDFNDLLQHYVVERALRLVRLVQHRPKDLINLLGWERRIHKFLPEAKPYVK